MDSSQTKTGLTVVLEAAPPNNLPDWNECALRVANSDFVDKRVAEGGYGPEPDIKMATQLHRFIYEYDDADKYCSEWFRHRLELVLEEAKQEVRRKLSEHLIQIADSRESNMRVFTEYGKDIEIAEVMGIRNAAVHIISCSDKEQ